MKLKNQTKLLQMCYEKNIKIAELEQKLETERSSRIALVNKIADLEAQIEKMKRCEICKHYRWNHCSYEMNISEDCIQNQLRHFELKEKENG